MEIFILFLIEQLIQMAPGERSTFRCTRCSSIYSINRGLLPRDVWQKWSHLRVVCPSRQQPSIYSSLELLFSSASRVTRGGRSYYSSKRAKQASKTYVKLCIYTLNFLKNFFSYIQAFSIMFHLYLKGVQVIRR